jgi:hypothetical protein
LWPVGSSGVFAAAQMGRRQKRRGSRPPVDRRLQALDRALVLAREHADHDQLVEMRALRGRDRRRALIGFDRLRLLAGAHQRIAVHRHGLEVVGHQTDHLLQQADRPVCIAETQLERGEQAARGKVHRVGFDIARYPHVGLIEIAPEIVDDTSEQRQRRVVTDNVRVVGF